MASQFTTGQGTQLTIPDQNEIYRAPDNSYIYQRQGNNVNGLSLIQHGQSLGGTSTDDSISRATADLAKKGVNVGSLNNYSDWWGALGGNYRQVQGTGAFQVGAPTSQANFGQVDPNLPKNFSNPNPDGIGVAQPNNVLSPVQPQAQQPQQSPLAGQAQGMQSALSASQPQQATLPQQGAPQGQPQGGMAFPKIDQNLAPGSTGSQVKALQQWLISQGANIPAGATGFYGQQTKAAVAAWQAKNPSINVGQNAGYFGPQSRALASQLGQQQPQGAPGLAQTGAPVASPYQDPSQAGAQQQGYGPSNTPQGANPFPGVPTDNSYEGLLKQLQQSQLPTAQEQALQKQLDAITGKQQNISAGEKLGEVNAQGQPIAQAFITGQQAALQRAAGAQMDSLGAQAVPLQQQLARLQAQRSASIDIAKTGLEYNKPVALPYGGQLVNPNSGKTVNGGIFGGSGQGSGVNPATGLQPGAPTSDILGYLSRNGVNPTRYDMPGLINAVQNGATAQDIISGKVSVAGQTSAATSGSSYKVNPLTGTFSQPNPSAAHPSAGSVSSPVTYRPTQSSGGSTSASSPLAPVVNPLDKLTGNALTLASTGVMPSGVHYQAQQDALTKQVQKAIPGWNPVNAQAAANFYKSPDTQKFIANSNTVINTLGQIKQLSSQVDRSNLTMLNNGQFALARATSDPSTAKLVQLSGILSDEIGKILGSGQGSDFTIQLGQSLVNPAYSKETFGATIDQLSGRVQNKVNEYMKQGGQAQGNTPAGGTNPLGI